MAAWLFLPLLALVPLAALRVRLGVLKLPGQAVRLGVAAGPFRLRRRAALVLTRSGLALSLTANGENRLIPVSGKKARAVRTPASRARKAALRQLVRRVRADRLDVSAVLCADDAAEAVLLCALLRACAQGYAAAHPDAPLRCRIDCAFSGRSRARLLGIFSVRAGHIMLAALRFARDYCIGRLCQWKNTPSKTS